ncbi:MAG: cell division protein FtsX [Flavobacteriales bacterium]|nr:permease-like cell division protein FtsX [Flavobacteriales bacterium]MCB9449730.1 cell division protein FtsX [Flavobacteriales bacterium]
MSKEKRSGRSKLQTSYVSTVISMALVLFVLGLLGIIILQARQISDHVKENIGFTVFFKENTKEVDILQFQKNLEAKSFIRHTQYVSKEEAAEQMEKELGEDFVSFIGRNPLLPSIDVFLHANYANNDSLRWITGQVEKSNLIDELVINKDLIDIVNSNIRKISVIMLAFSGLLLLVAVALINNTIRLAIYSRRFLIRSMQLVGATQGFIRRPFVMTGIIQGIVSSLIALSLLFAAMYYASFNYPEIFRLEEPDFLIPLFGGVILTGISIAGISTFLAVRKFLRLKADDLY